MNTKPKPGIVTHTEPSSAPPSHNPVLIQQALEEIFQSQPFRTTKQCQDLLRYVVENTLSGLDPVLRERVIGAEVFGRKPDYDTGEDPVVRLRAAEVRKRLAQYYQSASGSTRVRIDIPSGSYRATFEWMTPAEAQPMVAPAVSATAVTETAAPAAATALLPVESGPVPALLEPVSERQRLPGGKLTWGVGALLLLALLAGALWRVSRNTPESGFMQFWSPLLAGSKPVLVCMGSNAVYRLSNSFLQNYLKDHPLSDHGMEFFLNMPPETPMQVRDLQRAYNSFVALGDVAAVSDIVATLTRQNKPFQQRFPPDISFAELKNTPTITIGGFNNELTITLMKNLRFTLAAGSRVEDHQDHKVWAIKANGDAHDTEDYAVVTRLLDSRSGGPVLCIAGIGQYGTQAAAEFVSDPQRVAALMKAAPAGWNKRNLQVVLHIGIVDYRPVATDVVATQYW